ncbi:MULTISPECIES: ABC transporter substrate-binding protein [unclassified Streptomyces]|uniref:ABC transporter substrate-binding protein n=1 Tax=unclassified Streptomyces TaxID=2593676 RepID=UPI0006ADC7C8|nr:MULTISPECIES: ABC transporter substrate-binding protein [unclassified Streptomyces]KOX38266.1 ABC transporter substrate-binding protein [Streptomyces sp. NRRL F-6491]KOX52419.1 ABC transporter substrate-binding protein [Streptomyces sp. NRRL F-6492]
MSTRTSSGPARTTLVFALITAAALGLTACAGGDPATAPAGAPGAAKGALPTEDVVAGVKRNEAAAKLLPADVRQRGGFTVASSVATPPSSAYLPDGRTVVGVDADFSAAVAKALGLELKREAVGFEAILPALGSGKYDVGTGNFGVTEERRRTIDFVTYVNDGQGFAARADSPLKEITDLTQLCGLKVAVDAGTTFERTLEKNKGRCAEAGEKPYAINVYSEVGAVWMALQQGRSDVVMSTINGLRYAVTQQKGMKFLNEYRRLDVGFAFKKGTPLAPAFQAAVNGLKADGTYDRILRKWGVTGSGIERSQISPPEIPAPKK